jgi:hypothetical protein
MGMNIPTSLAGCRKNHKPGLRPGTCTGAGWAAGTARWKAATRMMSVGRIERARQAERTGRARQAAPLNSDPEQGDSGIPPQPAPR